MILIHQLNFIRDAMGANLFSFEKVNCIDIFADMEIPDTEELLTNAVHWLISIHDVVVVSEWIEVAEECCYGKGHKFRFYSHFLVNENNIINEINYKATKYLDC